MTKAELEKEHRILKDAVMGARRRFMRADVIQQQVDPGFVRAGVAEAMKWDLDDATEKIRKMRWRRVRKS